MGFPKMQQIVHGNWLIFVFHWRLIYFALSSSFIGSYCLWKEMVDVHYWVYSIHFLISEPSKQPDLWILYADTLIHAPSRNPDPCTLLGILIPAPSWNPDPCTLLEPWSLNTPDALNPRDTLIPTPSWFPYHCTLLTPWSLYPSGILLPTPSCQPDPAPSW